MQTPVVLISSSSDEDGNPEEEELESEVSSESDDQDYDEEEESDFESDEEEFLDNRDRVVCNHQGNDDVQELSLNECKAYLRKHGLRLSGSKEECLQRIKEHGRLKDGRGESLYPRSAFSINCTGDACKGDVVLFKQKVYKKRGDVVGKRSVAGRIVKESYGASKQQHTFTIEVLWSKGFTKLSPLSTLLVKGRNLYRYGIFRQPWKSEAERSKVLGEKHTRGEAARNKRKLRKGKFAPNNDKGAKRQKLSHTGTSRNKQVTRIDKQTSAKRRGAAPVNKSTSSHEKKAVQSQKRGSKRSTEPTFRDHHLQASSSSSFPYDYERTSFLSNLPPGGFTSYGHFTNGQPQPPQRNHVLYRPPGYYNCNYEQPFPRYP